MRGLFDGTHPAKKLEKIDFLGNASLHFYGSRGKRPIKTMKEPFLGRSPRNKR
jgi:hypothetical protein